MAVRGIPIEQKNSYQRDPDRRKEKPGIAGEQPYNDPTSPFVEKILLMGNGVVVPSARNPLFFKPQLEVQQRRGEQQRHKISGNYRNVVYSESV